VGTSVSDVAVDSAATGADASATAGVVPVTSTRRVAVAAGEALSVELNVTEVTEAVASAVSTASEVSAEAASEAVKIG